MTYQLKIDEILEALIQSGHSKAAGWQKAYEKLANEMAQVLAQKIDVNCGTGTFEGVEFAGLCVPFMPKYEGQPMPDAISNYDAADEWGE